MGSQSHNLHLFTRYSARMRSISTRRFEVKASVKPNKSGDRGMSMGPSAGLTATKTLR